MFKLTNEKLWFTKLEFIQRSRVLHKLAELLIGILNYHGADFNAMADATRAQDQAYEGAEIARAGANI